MAETTEGRPGAIHARPVPHPWRWVALAFIAVLVAMMISSFITNPRWDFPFALQVMNFNPVLNGLVQGTILGTFLAMILGVGLGVLVGIMRLSSNPVLRGVAFVYTWFFRAIPRYVLLVILGTGLGYLYSNFDIGVPFGQQISKLFGLSSHLTFFSLNVNQFSSTLLMGVIGLGLSEAAYMAEIARAGILSVDRGQVEAAQALGMSSSKTMRRIVLPQAMRVIVPPTGNETIAMVKDTSLLIAIPVNAELFYQASTIGSRTLKIMPTYVAATAWYLIVCSVLMVGQYWLERRFGRGFGTTGGANPSVRAKLLSLRGGGGGGAF
ncbi:amino acid ABC transporter permease [Nostocoides sp. HKS02]|uniref:amino acid ABC transporter permease n=1 Tax=Nostocoides sp. HKS02 TaxID=1813880 RepID=UPI0012B47790|nr:amino acid ABC transporter permease [Tetrasphaera sp. HKS02]QGN57963.1 ABC transporter permease subunit [Tetrasphaera sp. HKS02]